MYYVDEVIEILSVRDDQPRPTGPIGTTPLVLRLRQHGRTHPTALRISQDAALVLLVGLQSNLKARGCL
jgi:hypothetical protein